MNHRPIGVFDSGIGGLSVANAIYGLLPHESMIYYADTGRVPYGPRPRAQIQAFAHEITAFLLNKGCKMIVVACNTATAAALEDLRRAWPDVDFVGMEPAVKPAAAATRNGRVGVMATLATISSERYAELMRRYAAGVEVYEDPCLGLVPLIERGLLDHPETDALLDEILNPMLARDIDTLVLGCTHYPFILPRINAKLAGGDRRVIDPAPAVARQTARLLQTREIAAPPDAEPAYTFYHSGPTAELALFTQIPFVSVKVNQGPL